MIEVKNICEATPQELEEFNNWLHHGGPNKKEIEAQKIYKLRQEIAEECREKIKAEVQLITSFVLLYGKRPGVIEKNTDYFIDGILEIIRGE